MEHMKMESLARRAVRTTRDGPCGVVALEGSLIGSISRQPLNGST